MVTGQICGVFQANLEDGGETCRKGGGGEGEGERSIEEAEVSHDINGNLEAQAQNPMSDSFYSVVRSHDCSPIDICNPVAFLAESSSQIAKAHDPCCAAEHLLVTS